jgi:16S rRNA (cytidine1402-2'-O)-methyltransferase
MSKLYIVPTPIGNLEDMTFRAIRILKVDLILAEDTRTSGKLLKHFEIGTHMYSHHMHNEHKTVENLISFKSRRKYRLNLRCGNAAIRSRFLLTRACVEKWS